MAAPSSMQQGSQGIVHQLLIEFWMTIVHAKKMQHVPIKKYRAHSKYSSKAALVLSISNDQLAWRSVVSLEMSQMGRAEGGFEWEANSWFTLGV